MCEAGYQPKNGLDSEKDSPQDCELIPKVVCLPGVEIDVQGNCVVDPNESCKSQCGETGGTLV